MLHTLRIKNLALVPDLTLEVEPGFNVITGETGAGKSIILGALKLLLGERADRNSIRSGSDACTVEAAFEVKNIDGLPSFLEENGIEISGSSLVIKRSFAAAGANRQFVNGSPTTLAVLERLGAWLVDMHGPHEHQSLLHPQDQLHILDAFGKTGSQGGRFRALLEERRELLRQKNELVVDDKTYAEKMDLLRFQVHEIDGANLRAGEEVEVENEFRRANNSARLLELLRGALDQLAEADLSALEQCRSLGRTLQELEKIDPSARSFLVTQGQIVALLRDLESDLSHYADKVEVDPRTLRSLEERFNFLQGLRRKYGPTIQAVIDFGNEARRSLQELEGRDEALALLNGRIDELTERLWITGQELSKARRKILPKLSAAVTGELQQLGFPQGRLDISIFSAGKAEGEAAFTPSGLDRVEFQFAPNPGEPARPLRAIASSGEMSRVMLALKTVLAHEDRIPVLVFDEIDANVGGEIGRVVAQKMEQISQTHQVFCITHLPAVAAGATAHYLVSKEVDQGRTVSTIARLDEAGRLAELTRMLGGTGEAAKKHAESLLKNQRRFSAASKA